MIEHVIFSHVLFNDEYMRKVIPYLKPEYFHEKSDEIILEKVLEYFHKYNVAPSKTALVIDIDNSEQCNENLFKKVSSTIESLELDQTVNKDWLLEETEKFCKERALHNAIRKAITILDKDSKETAGSIPKLVEDALSVSFDSNVGHDFFEDIDKRFEFYHRVEDKIPFDIDILNVVTKGGVPKKTLNIIMAGTNVGKSLIMCHMASSDIQQGRNVLYITMEMSEERIAERIDGNIMNIKIDDIITLPHDSYSKKLNALKEKTKGKLIVKEYPTGGANVNNFRYVLSELKQKKNFVPDVIYIDYLNICCSSKVKVSSNVPQHLLIKYIAEEIRGLAVEHDIPVWSATQTNRAGSTNSDFETDSVSESFSLVMTADLLLGIISTEELSALGQYMFKQLKNRYGDKNKNKRFIVGVDYDRMKLYNIEQQGQLDVAEDIPIMSNSKFFEDDNKKTKKSKFSGFK